MQHLVDHGGIRREAAHEFFVDGGSACDVGGMISLQKCGHSVDIDCQSLALRLLEDEVPLRHGQMAQTLQRREHRCPRRRKGRRGLQASQRLRHRINLFDCSGEVRPPVCLHDAPAAKGVNGKQVPVVEVVILPQMIETMLLKSVFVTGTAGDAGDPWVVGEEHLGVQCVVLVAVFAVAEWAQLDDFRVEMRDVRRIRRGE